jgi:hypothetical protein
MTPIEAMAVSGSSVSVPMPVECFVRVFSHSWLAFLVVQFATTQIVLHQSTVQLLCPLDSPIGVQPLIQN